MRIHWQVSEADYRERASVVLFGTDQPDHNFEVAILRKGDQR